MAIRWYLAYALCYWDIEELMLERGVKVDHSTLNRWVIYYSPLLDIDAINFQLMMFNLFVFLFTPITIRQIKYLNNIVEQDHRGIKRIAHPMMGFKSFNFASATIAGIKLHRMLKKGQHKNSANQSIFEQFYALAA